MQRDMISRMRKSQRFNWRSILFFVSLGLLLNLVVAYSSAWRAGALGFSMADGAYGNWNHFVEFEDGWRTDGTTFGVTGWYISHSITDPLDLFNKDRSVSDKGGTVQTTNKFGNRIGWPLRCIECSQTWLEVKKLRPKAESEGLGRVISTINTDFTPRPYWYFKGIETNFNNSVLGGWIPIRVRPFQLILNTLIFSTVVYFIHSLIVRLKHSRRKHRGLCLACGYAVEDLEICPECATERFHDRG
jgi:hypothetical protein